MNYLPSDKGSNPCALPSCQNSVRTAVEQSHATFQHQQYQIKSVIPSAAIKKHPPMSTHGPSYCDKGQSISKCPFGVFVSTK